MLGANLVLAPLARMIERKAQAEEAERQWMTDLLHHGGLVDVYRHLEPAATDDAYTWWSNRGQAYAKNVGWRLDYHLASPTIAHLARQATIYKAEKFSDHAPLTIDYDLSL